MTDALKCSCTECGCTTGVSAEPWKKVVIPVKYRRDEQGRDGFQVVSVGDIVKMFILHNKGCGNLREELDEHLRKQEG